MVQEEIKLAIIEHIHKYDEQSIKEIMIDYHPYDIAQVFKQLSEQERQALYETLSEEDIALILSYLDPSETKEFIKEMSYIQGANVLGEMDADDATDILKELEDVETNDYLEHLEEASAKDLSYLSTHEEDTAGSIMTTNFITIPSNVDVKDAMKILGKEANDAEVIDPLFVCDDGILKGVLSLQDLIIARTPKLVSEIMDVSFVSCEVNDDTNLVANKITNYDVYAMPILDNGVLVGIVTMDDALDVAQASIEEDFTMMAAVTEEEVDNAPFWKNILKRIPWLVTLLFISLLISNVTKTFEGVISKITILWFFNTMILDMAGNAGTQTLALTVRHLSRNEINSFKKGIKYLARELFVTLISALFLGLLSFIICFTFIKVLGYDAKVHIIITSLIVSGSLTITLTITGILGAIIPILINKVHLDPAVASGPLITTINDIVAMIVYFGLATIFMDYILL